MEQPEIIRQTASLCPVCQKTLPAALVRRGDDVYMEKTCAEHGDFCAVVWRGPPDYEAWCAKDGPPPSAPNPRCPGECGLCAAHLRGTCCVLVEVTGRCNLRCAYCFADAPPAPDPPADELGRLFTQLASDGRRFIQLSGGEPTLRDDLPELVALAKAAGADYVQLNTNGLRLAEDEAYVKALAGAGLSFVFLQFDGLRDEIYEALRGAPLLAQKQKAIDNCAKHRLGVTLVPTLVPGVNTSDLWAIVRYGAARSPDVRGVHFQPVSYFGRHPEGVEDAARITLPEVVRGLVAQSGGALAAESFVPSSCDHPACGFHADFIARPGGLHPLSRASRGGAGRGEDCCGQTIALQNREYIGSRWLRRDTGKENPYDSLASLDGFLTQKTAFGFTVTAMAFQDSMNIDLARLRRCSLHVAAGGKIVPFCRHYYTGAGE